MINSGGINYVGINSGIGVIAAASLVIDTRVLAPPGRRLLVPIIGSGFLGRVEQQDDDVVDYNLDFGEWLNGDLLTSCEFTSPSEISIGLFTTLPTLVKLWVQDGFENNEYKIRATARTRAGRVKQVEFIVVIK